VTDPVSEVTSVLSTSNATSTTRVVVLACPQVMAAHSIRRTAGEGVFLRKPDTTVYPTLGTQLRSRSG
jgi:hypothetical protein